MVRLATKDENGKNLVLSRPYFYIYFVHFRIYGKIQKWDGSGKGCIPPVLAGSHF